MTAISRFGSFLRTRQRWVLIALLVVLHLTLLAGVGSPVGLMLWLVDLGLFILWQPFIQAERKLDSSALSWTLAVIAGGLWLYGWWLLILWVVVLTALLGGRVMLLAHRPTRIFYLLAFTYLLGALLIWLVPKVVPNTSLIGPSLDTPFVWGAPLLFVAMLLMPRPRAIHMPSRGMVDFFYSLFIFLLISVLVLGSLAFMLLRNSLYVEALFKTLISMAGMLLLIAWAWNPRPGFSGLGVFLSRYLLTIGLPFETWLQRLMESAESENDPDQFLRSAFERMLELPWLVGGAWSATSAVAGSGCFGRVSAFRQDFSNQPLLLTLYTQHKLSPSLIWHFQLLVQLTNEYYITKQRARELQQMSYLRAVHETGARLTHDVKNLLQSLNNLCFMAQQSPDGADGTKWTLQLQRQLPQITQRLQQTLEKLQAPQSPKVEAGGIVLADGWWDILRQRYSQDGIVFTPVEFDAGASLPATLFDSVVDNLVRNALLKRQSESGLILHVSLAGNAELLSVCDSGSAVREDVLNDLLCAPVASDNGLGIGLYHAAKQAGNYGYELRLSSNMAGRVCFELSKS